MLRYIGPIMLAMLLCVAVNPVSFAGGHTGGAPKEVLMDPAKRTDITGTVLITGSNRGIGLEITRNYAERGWTVIATARKPEKAEDLQAIAKQHSNVTIERLDLLDHAGIDSLASKLADTPIDVLMLNAAVLGEPNEQNFGEFNYDLMRWVFDVNVVGQMKMAEAFVGSVAMSEQKKIVAITSQQGSISSVFSSSIVFYNTSKAALNMAMRSNSKALKKRGITIALISPGAVDTDMMNLALDRAGVTFKLLTPQQSAEAVINVTDQYGLDKTGTFMSHQGTEIPW